MTMQIGSVPSIPAVDPVPSASAPATAHANGAGAANGGSVVAGASASLSSGAGGSQSSSRVLSPLDEALAAVYTTSVGGHNYLGTVQQTAGEYVASAADPPAPPITGVGASIVTAENNLTMVIDEMA